METTELGKRDDSTGATWRSSVAIAIGLLVALAVFVNAYSYTMITAIPLIQSDAWYFLDGFLGEFIREGFSFGQLFAQANAANVNLPLQKAILFFHTRYFGMDFRVEGLFGTASGIALVLVLARAAAARSIRTWSVSEVWLLAALALSLLSLNSTNLYTWPLAGLWFLPILVGAGYMWIAFVFPRAPVGLLVASFVLGVLLDEVAYPVFLATLGALMLAPHWRAPRQIIILLGVGVAGIGASRLFYWATAAFGEATRPSRRPSEQSGSRVGIRTLVGVLRGDPGLGAGRPVRHPVFGPGRDDPQRRPERARPGRKVLSRSERTRLFAWE